MKISDNTYNLEVKGDDRGKLVAIEGGVNIPFNIKRIFYIYNTLQNVPRGNHAHYATKQFLIAVKGKCKVTLDDGVNKKTFLLDKPDFGILQQELVWGVMHDFSDDCVLLVLADELYDSSDYINDYNTFLSKVNDAKNSPFK